MASVGIRDVRKAYGATQVIHGVDITINDGEFVVLVGPSGCGKSTLLRMIAGLENITGGEIRIGERVVNNVPPKERDIAMVFQNYALYPHMTVAANMGFSLKLRGADKSEIDTRVHRAAEILGLMPLLERFPRQLSGGQRQRVAMGRAIVRDPQVFLFDEPLSNLDAKLRVSMRSEIRNLQQTLKITTVYVTHDQEEAMAISDRIAVMEAGRIVQLDTAEALYRRPTSAFVAGFIGRANLVRAVVESVTDGRATLDVGGNKLVMRANGVPAPGSLVRVVMRPEAISIVTSNTGLTAIVQARTYLGDKIEYEIMFGGQTLNIVRFNPEDDEQLLPGATVFLSISEVGVRLVETA